MITRTCAQCSKPYQTFPSVRPVYCSHACASAAKRRGQSRPCAQCGTDFYAPPSMAQRFCSKSCATTARNLTEQNPSLHRDIRGERNPMWKGGKVGPRTGASNPMYGRRRALAPQWKGGRKIRKDGYVLVVAPEGHPHPADIHRGTGIAYILEHRLIMERHLGRYLLPEEVVHHKDFNPSNNALDNLTLFANQSEHNRIGHPRRRITARLKERLQLPPQET